MPVEIASLQQLRALINSPKVTVVDFYATWCGPCKAVAPQYEQMSRYYDSSKVSFCKVDVDRCQDCAAAFHVTAMPTFIVFRNGEVVESIRGANMQRLQQVVDVAVSQVPAAFSGQGRSLGSGGSGQSSLLDSAAAPPSSKVLDTLAQHFFSLQQALSENDAVKKKDCCDAIYKITITNESGPMGSSLLPYLMASDRVYSQQCLSAVFDYIQTMAAPERDDGNVIVWSLTHWFVNVFTSTTFHAANSSVALRALWNLVRCPPARAALTKSNRFHARLAANGEELERQSLLGSAVGIGIRVPLRGQSGHSAVGMFARQQRILDLLRAFPLEPSGVPVNPQSRTSVSLDRVQTDKAVQDTQLQLEGLAAQCFPIFRELLGDKDGSRQATLAFIASMLEKNSDYTKTMMDNSRVSSVSGMVTLTNVLIDLAIPIAAVSSFEPSTIPSYYLHDPNALIGFGAEVERIAHFSNESPLPPLPATQVSGEYQPRVHLFFAAIRAIGLTSTSALLRYDTYARNASFPGMRAQDRHYFLAECANTRALLGGRTVATKMLRFLNGVARWLLHVMGAKPDGSLPAEVPVAWKAMPQSIVDDVIRGTKLVTTLRVQISAAELHDVYSLMLVLMGNATYFPKPHTHALFPPFLTAMLQDRESSDALQRHPWFHEHIVKGCMMCYIAMEKSEYEKVQTRYELSHCLRAFLRNASLCAPVKREFEETNSEALERFSHMVTADVNAAVDAIVKCLQSMNSIAASGGDVSPTAAPPRQDNEDSDEEGGDAQRAPPQRTYHQHGEELKSHLQLFDVSVDVFIEMTVQFPKGVAQNLVSQQISQMLARSITTFAGPKYRELVIKNGEAYGFQLRQVLTKLVECFVQFQDSDVFNTHLCECGVPVKEIYDSMGLIVHKRLVRDDLCGRLTTMYNKMLSVEKMVEDNAALWDDAPDWALDVILSTPLTDPVAIPTEVRDVEDLVFTNRATLHHALLTEPKNPFTKEYLDEAMVDAFNSKPEVAAALRKLKTNIAKWLAEATAAAAASKETK